MANYKTWTVLPHDPIEALADNLWRVQAMMAGGKVQRQMVVARMRDGGLVIHNAIALDEPGMQRLEAWGRPSVLFVPNAFHRQDAFIWKQRYPQLTVAAPPGARKRVAKAVAVDVVTADAPGDDTVRLRDLAGCPGESVLEVRSGDALTAVFNDVILNVPKRTGMAGFFLAPTGKVSVPRFARLMLIKDRRAFTAQLDALAAQPGLRRVLFAHGQPVTGDAAAAELRAVSTQLRG